MSRYSPTVLEQPFDLGVVIDQMIEGYYGGRQRKPEARSRRRPSSREGAAKGRGNSGLGGQAHVLLLPLSLNLHGPSKTAWPSQLSHG